MHDGAGNENRDGERTSMYRYGIAESLYVGRDVYGMYGKGQEQQRIVDFRTDNGKARFEDADRGW